MENNNQKRTAIFLIAYVILAIGAFVAILAIPATREVFKKLSSHPYTIYPMGFLKFAILATAGELIAARMANGVWKKPSYILGRAAVWGILGIGITYVMHVFTGGINYMMYARHFLPGLNLHLRAFYISATMNIAFGPTFMAAHRVTDAWFDLMAQGKPHSIADAVRAVDWSRFVTFTVCKVIPIFWIPAHTITFMLPAEYQVMMAAGLSVALGILLQIKRRPKQTAETTEEV